MHHSANALAERHPVTVIGPTGGNRHCADGVRYAACPPSPWLFLPCALVRGLVVLMRRRVRLVIGGSGLVAPVTTVLARLAGSRAMIFVHGLDLVASSATYRRLFLPLIRRHDRIVANSRNTRRLAVDRGCEPARVAILNPGCRVADSPPLVDDGFVTANNLDGRPVLLFVGRMIERKGLAPFIENAWPRIVDAVPQALLLVVGDSPDDAVLRDTDGGEAIRAAVERAPRNSICFLGRVDDAVLTRCYTLANCLVFPLISVGGDVEGFGMVAVEAAACGTPTIAFDTGGVADAVAEGITGALVPEGNYEAFADRCVGALTDQAFPAQAIRDFARRFDWSRHATALEDLVYDCLERRPARPTRIGPREPAD